MERHNQKKNKKVRQSELVRRDTTDLTACLYRKSKTKPNGKKPPTEEKKPYVEPDYTKVRVVDFDLKELVVLPPEIDLNEWLASNSKRIKFYFLVVFVSRGRRS